MINCINDLTLNSTEKICSKRGSIINFERDRSVFPISKKTHPKKNKAVSYSIQKVMLFLLGAILFIAACLFHSGNNIKK
jgi:hypothetical protein